MFYERTDCGSTLSSLSMVRQFKLVNVLEYFCNRSSEAKNQSKRLFTRNNFTSIIQKTMHNIKDCFYDDKRYTHARAKKNHSCELHRREKHTQKETTSQGETFHLQERLQRGEGKKTWRARAKKDDRTEV